MQLKREGSEIIDADFISPKYVVGLFAGNISPATQDRIICYNNFGEEVYCLWKAYMESGERDIRTVCKFLDELDKLYQQYIRGEKQK